MNIEQAIDILKNSVADYVIGEYCEKCADNKICDDRNEDCYFQQAIDIVVTSYEKEKEKNKKYEKLICRVRNLSSGVVSYDIINGKKYLGPRKNFSKQRLYEQFLNIELILKGNYIFLSNEEFLKELLGEE